LGLEVAGEVVALAPDVTTLQESDYVFCFLTVGGYAEFCSTPAKQSRQGSCGIQPVLFDRGRAESIFEKKNLAVFWWWPGGSGPVFGVAGWVWSRFGGGRVGLEDTFPPPEMMCS
jgi:hypothetical protein